MKHAILVSFATGLSLAIAATAVRAAEALVLEDQFGAEFALEGAHERAFVIVYSDRAGSKLTRPWREFLDGYADSIEVIGAANLGSAPRIARPYIRKAFDKAPPTLLDWKGALAERFGFEPEVPNIYVFERTGELRGALSGPGSKSELTALRELLERL
jgi:hypothetical protein